MEKVICVHGIFNTGKVFEKLRMELQAAGYEVLCVSLSPRWGNGDLRELARQLQAAVEDFLEVGERAHFVAFSMGGLVTRYFLQRLGGLQLAQSLVCISTPHQGTVMGYALPLIGCRQMRRGSAFLSDLNRDVEVLGSLRPLSLWTKYDLMIVPAKSSQAAVGEAAEFSVPIHAMMVRNEAVIDRVLKYVADSGS